jgi:beta-N-acetylhexosaminidase
MPAASSSAADDPVRHGAKVDAAGTPRAAPASAADDAMRHGAGVAAVGTRSAASSSAADDPMSPSSAAIVGVAGPALDDAERRLIAARRPWGFILFGRNCVDPPQVSRLVAALRAAVGDPQAPVLIDQEGGRVMRLRPPHWPARPPLRSVGRLAEDDPAAGREAAWLHARLIAADLHELGITIDCAPVLDLASPEGTAAIGDRALSADPALVGELGQALTLGFLAGGVLPVIKHLPGHGRARVDSHLSLPAVDASLELMRRTDWQPFRACRAAPLAITAHVRFAALDPAQPATLSSRVIGEVIRGELGFAGLLLSDDLSMGALTGSLGARAAAARAAGCDLALHCNGRPDEMADVLAAAGPLEGAAAARAARALARLRPPEPLDRAAAEARLAALLASAPAFAAAGV